LWFTAQFDFTLELGASTQAQIPGPRHFRAASSAPHFENFFTGGLLSCNKIAARLLPGNRRFWASQRCGVTAINWAGASPREAMGEEHPVGT
jgi:hypothetical protein